MNEITVNWHILQRCNYTCDYCFAEWDKHPNKEVHNSKKEIELLLNKLYLFLIEKHPNYSIRLNIAGGEPTLSKNLEFIIQRAYAIGFNISLITNLSRITSRFIESNAKYISMFAISIDSLNYDTNLKIGRASKGQTLEVSKILKHIENIKCINSDIKIKINTVVNAHNYQEYLGNFIDLIKPYKWKVFQALSIDTEEVFCDYKQFSTFLNNHKNASTTIYGESNEAMTDSYIMIDPHGRFYQNTNGKYTYSLSLLNTSAEQAFKSIAFDFIKFNLRYVSRNDK